MHRRDVTAVVMSAALWGCGTEPVIPEWGTAEAFPVHGINLSGEVQLSARVVRSDDDVVRAELVLLNESPNSVEGGTGECFARLRAYASPARREPAVWAEQPAAPYGFCADVGHLIDIAPADSVTLTRSWPRRYFVSWPPPSGSHLGLVVILNDEPLLIPASEP